MPGAADRRKSRPRARVRTERTRDKARTHERILDSAAKLFRTRGVEQTRVVDVMKGAGLTIGGFYAHFASKDALVEASFRRAMAELRPILLRELEGASEWRRLEVVLQRYLSRDHRDHPPGGCPLPAMVAELSASGEAGRAALAEELERTVRLVAGSDDAAARARMLGLLALMVGGVALSRALKGARAAPEEVARATALSDELLKACRDLGRAAMRGTGLRPDGEWTG